MISNCIVDTIRLIHNMYYMYTLCILSEQRCETGKLRVNLFIVFYRTDLKSRINRIAITENLGYFIFAANQLTA